MSTTIYGAWKVQNITIEEFIVKLKKFKNNYINSFADYVKKTKGDMNYREVFNEIRGRTDVLFGAYEDDASAVIYFHENNVYVQFFGLRFNRNVQKEFEGCLVDFHYQDQSDPWYDIDFSEGKLTEKERDEAEKEYNKRKQIWNEIYKDGWTPSKNGLIFEICTKNDAGEIARKAFGMIT